MTKDEELINEALDRLCETLTEQQVEDLQLVIKHTKRKLEICENCGDCWVGDTDATLEILAEILNFQPDYPEYGY